MKFPQNLYRCLRESQVTGLTETLEHRTVRPEVCIYLRFRTSKRSLEYNYSLPHRSPLATRRPRATIGVCRNHHDTTSQLSRHPLFSVIDAPAAFNYSPHQAPDTRPKKLFLSGRISPSSSGPQTWQDELTARLQHLPLMILNPLRRDWDSSWEADISFPPFVEQVNWELDGLEAADIVVVYFSPTSDSPITLLEFGITVAEKAEKVICWCPEQYSKRGNVEIVCGRRGVRVLESIDEVVDEVNRRVGSQK